MTAEQKLIEFRAIVKSNLANAEKYSHDPEHDALKFTWQERANTLYDVLTWSKILE